MARTLTDIKTALKVSFMSNEKLASTYSFETGADFDTEFSKVSLENILIDIISFSSWSLEQLFDLHKKDVTDQIANMKPHSLRWYRSKSKAFQFGYPLITDTDEYDNSTLTDAEIIASNIIKYCAVNEAVNESRLIVKIATENAEGLLAPIKPEELVSFKQYMSEVKDAGLTISVTNYLPDILSLEMKIYYDPLILSLYGSKLTDGSRPVEIAINNFLKELPFNGVLQLTSLVEALKKIEGVQIPHIVEASSSWINPATGTYGMAMPIEVFKIPESGYFKVNDFSKLTYLPYE
jgi:hypothetical protein